MRFLRMGGRPTNSIISRVLLILEHKIGVKLKLRYNHVFVHVLRYVNLLTFILININENLKN